MEPISSKTILIVAYEPRRGIGYDGKLPWHLPADLSLFRQATIGHAVVMGRKTYESIGHPLRERHNLVLSKTHSEPDQDIACGYKLMWDTSLPHAVWKLHIFYTPRVFIIGGEAIYCEALKWNLVDEIYATEVHETYTCDTFFPIKDYEAEGWEEVYREDYRSFRRVLYKRRKPIEEVRSYVHYEAIVDSGVYAGSY